MWDLSDNIWWRIPADLLGKLVMVAAIIGRQKWHWHPQWLVTHTPNLIALALALSNQVVCGKGNVRLFSRSVNRCLWWHPTHHLHRAASRRHISVRIIGRGASLVLQRAALFGNELPLGGNWVAAIVWPTTHPPAWNWHQNCPHLSFKYTSWLTSFVC